MTGCGGVDICVVGIADMIGVIYYIVGSVVDSGVRVGIGCTGVDGSGVDVTYYVCCRRC